MSFCSKCGAVMVSKLDLEDCSQFWDCPNLCIGTKPLAEPKRKKMRRDAPSSKTSPPVIEVPIQARPRNEASYSSEAWTADTNMQAGGALPHGHLLRFWKPTCSICGRDAEFSPFSESLDRCWIHGGPVGCDGQDKDDKRKLAWVFFFLLLGAIIRIAWHVTRVAP